MYKSIKNIALATLVSGSVLLTGCMKTVGVHVRTEAPYRSYVGYCIVPERHFYTPIRPVLYTVPRTTLDIRVGLTRPHVIQVVKSRYIPRPKPVKIYVPKYRAKVNEFKRPQRIQRPERIQKQERPIIRQGPVRQRPIQQNRQRQPFPQPRRKR